MGIGYPNYKEGTVDEKFGGIITDINSLKIGTRFYVNNCKWYATLLEDNKGTYIQIENKNGEMKIKRLENDKKYLFPISDIQLNVFNNNNHTDKIRKVYPCDNCKHIDYCINKCEKFNEWLKHVQSIQALYENNKMSTYIIPKKVVSHTMDCGKHVPAHRYPCPNCGKFIISQICKRDRKPKHCYECGQLLMF